MPARARSSGVPQRIGDEPCLGIGVGLAVACMPGGKPAFQVLAPSRELVIAAQLIPEGDLLCPARMAGADHVQVRAPPLPAGDWLDVKPPPRPPLPLRWHMTPA